jgi:hypothetical protein
MRGGLWAAGVAGAVACAVVTLTAGCSSSPATLHGSPVQPSVTAKTSAASAVVVTASPSQASPAARSSTAAATPPASPPPATTPAAPTAAAAGPCTAAQLALGAQQPGTLFTSGGTATVSVTQDVRNTGGRCTLRLPATIEVAGHAGSFVAADVSASGGSEPHVIAHGQVVALALGSWWPSDGHKLVPSSSSSWCKAPVTDVTSVQVPLAAGSIQFRLQDTFQGVCQVPGTLALVLNAS